MLKVCVIMCHDLELTRETEIVHQKNNVHYHPYYQKNNVKYY